MTNSVSNRQMVFILFLVLMSLSAIDVSRQMAMSAGTGAWLTLLITSIIIALASMVVGALNNTFPGKMVFDYSGEITCKFVAYLLAAYYIIYFSMVFIYQLTGIAKLLQGEFLLLTPRWVNMLIGLPVFAAIAYKGITNLARIAEIIGLVFIISAIFVQTLMVVSSKVENILPLFDLSKTGTYFTSVKDALFSFLGPELLLIIPFTKGNGGKKAIRTIFLSILGIGLLYIFIVESCIMKIGIHDIAHYNDSLIIAIRATDVPFLDFMQRMDILYLTVGFMGFFVGTSFLYIAVLEFLCKIFAKASRLLLTIALSVLFYVAGLLVDPIQGYPEFLNKLFLFMGPVSLLLIPSVLLIIAKVKKRGQKAN